MRCLLLHCDYLEFEAKKKAIKNPQDLTEPKGRLEDCIVCFIAVEKPDESDPSTVVNKLVATIDEMSAQVGSKNIVVYPYAHLSSDLSDLANAQKVLDETYEIVKTKYTALKAPFGWYKSFELKCKGHPLSELSRTISCEGEEKKDSVVSEALKKEDKIKSRFYILTEDGTLHEMDKYKFGDGKNLQKFAQYEKSKAREVDKPPPHIELMRRLELVDYEPASDGGNMRYYPKGRMIKALLEQYISEKIHLYGGVEVETPIMYDLKHPTLEKYLNRFPARQYIVESEDKKYFLRFAACFGQFLMAKDATISYRHLPLRLYELARYAFRREKSGELAGLRRLRAFTMPDVHALCTDLDQAMDEYKKRFQLCVETIEGIGLKKDDFELGIRVTSDFYKEHKQFVNYLVKQFGKPVLVEMWDERIFYFLLKYEFNFVDALGKASALSTDQIDVENGITYDIQYTNQQGEQKHPVILHCSPSGAVERVIYALLEKAYMDSTTGGTAALPLWLCPTQVRIIPVSEKFNDDADQICEKLNSLGIRADIDDRNESMGKKIRSAGKEWIPYTVVYGEKEKETGKLSVRVRGLDEQISVDIDELVQRVSLETEGKPKRMLPLPRHLSRRPIFVG